ncbi:conserved exported protein of unknown function [Nitrospira sp. KM1]|uniref:hypothetical protein n=1 Tax=Nitrospira sp. KM1 TaxID=1936990 RepID=UPI0013A74FCE|nr:hypothetical protein [Nitrospira sp. KM1]BCA53418.1 conserved exported protein of unknown function [Nitrospira sp. KM1]
MSVKVFILAVWVGLAGCAQSGYGKTEQSWDSWIGTSKDDRVRDQGIPIRCHGFANGGEACEWPIRWSPESSGTLTMQFDAKGKACQWTYRDAYAEQRSAQKCL